MFLCSYIIILTVLFKKYTIVNILFWKYIILNILFKKYTIVNIVFKKYTIVILRFTKYTVFVISIARLYNTSAWIRQLSSNLVLRKLFIFTFHFSKYYF